MSQAAPVPPRTVLCIASKALETWAAAALYPNDPVVRNTILECGGTRCQERDNVDADGLCTHTASVFDDPTATGKGAGHDGVWASRSTSK